MRKRQSTFFENVTRRWICDTTLYFLWCICDTTLFYDVYVIQHLIFLWCICDTILYSLKCSICESLTLRMYYIQSNSNPKCMMWWDILCSECCWCYFTYHVSDAISYMCMSKCKNKSRKSMVLTYAVEQLQSCLIINSFVGWNRPIYLQNIRTKSKAKK